jgi:hypothetical protein
MKYILFILSLAITIAASETAYAQDCYTIDRSRPEWREADTVSVVHKGQPGVDCDFRLSPNPIEDIGRIDCRISKSTHLIINIIDIKGRMVKNIFDGYLPAGRRRIEFSTNSKEKNISPGTYYFVIESGNKNPVSIKAVIE